MIGNLIDLDKTLFLALNHFAAPGVDPIMGFITGYIPWVLCFIAVLAMLIKQEWRPSRTRFFILLGGIILTYALTDLVSVHLFKDVFMRLRPCHEPALAGQVRLPGNHCGGQYGFVSSHAANSFGLALIASRILNRRWFTISIFSWAIIVSYSRIYMGVHYPGDVLCGLLLGCLIGLGVFALLQFILKKCHPGSPISTHEHP